MVATAETIDQVQSLAGTYKYGFVTDIETELAPKGLSEDIVRFISAKKNEPEWLLQWRLDAYAKWLEMDEPDWSKLNYEPIDYQDAYYYAAPKSMEDAPESLDDVDPALIETYNKLGIPLHEQEILAGVKNPVAVASLDIGNCVGTAAVANQQAITLCIVARTRGVRRAFHQASISILAFTGANALTDDAAGCVLTDVNHLGSRVCLLAVVGNRNTIELAT